jgi:branched-chain amino acid aminotransferase
VTSFRTQRSTDSTSAEGAKIGNYLVSVLAMRQASLVGAVEALIVDSSGRVLEGGSSNVFLVSAGRLVTPPEDAGILAGITRAHIVALAAANGLAIELRAPALSEFYEADEVFITSSIREVVPVVKVDGRTIGSGRPGPVASTLLKSFREQVASGGLAPLAPT